MNIIPYTSHYAEQIATLLNRFLPFEPENAATVEAAGGIRFLCVEDEQIIGYIAGYTIEKSTEEFPYFGDVLQPLHEKIAAKSTLYSSHFVVHPNFRQRGIGKALVQAYMDAAKAQVEAVVVVGWVQSDTAQWAAKRQFLAYPFVREAYIARYFERYEVYCPNCNGTCFCDADIYYLDFSMHDAATKQAEAVVV